MTNVVGPERSWRLVHDGQRVVVLFESGGYTKSSHTIFTAATEQACLDEIGRLGLAYEPDEFEV